MNPMVSTDGLIVRQERMRFHLLSRLIAFLLLVLMAPAFALAGLMLLTIVFTVPASLLFCYLGIYWNTFFHAAFGRPEVVYRIQCGQCGREFKSRQPLRLGHFHCLCPGCFMTNRIDRKRLSILAALTLEPAEESNLDKRALK
ncbi:MAG: hypothetical protein ACM3YO_09235 [Bacteroidota bacterium]